MITETKQQEYRANLWTGYQRQLLPAAEPFLVGIELTQVYLYLRDALLKGVYFNKVLVIHSIKLMVKN